MRGTSTGKNLIPLNLEIEVTCRRNNVAKRRRELQEVQINQGERGPSSELSSPSLVTSPPLMDPSSSPHSDSHWPIAIREGTRFTRTPHPFYNFFSYHRLSPSYSSFVFSIKVLLLLAIL